MICFGAPPRDERGIDAAIAWYVCQASGQMSSDEQAALARWLAEDPDHARAWRRRLHMGERLHGGAPSRLPPTVARSVLERLPDLERRKALRLPSWAVLGGTGLYLGRGPLGDAAFPADYRSATGERRTVRLADGALLQLNTDSAVDVRFDEAGRRIRLCHGEIQIVTASDPAGRQLLFGRDGGGSAQPLDESRQAWTDGMISTENRHLDDLLAELGRHRAGYLGCDPAVTDLRISGAFQLLDTDAILASLPQALPAQAVYRSRYWVALSTAGAADAR